METFVATNCAYLDDDNVPPDLSKFTFSTKSSKSAKSTWKGYQIKQYDIWKNFHEIAEQILNSFLASIGGSIEKLEKALDEISSQSRFLFAKAECIHL